MEGPKASPTSQTLPLANQRYSGHSESLVCYIIGWIITAFKGVWGLVTGLSVLVLIFLSATEDRGGFYSKVLD